MEKMKIGDNCEYGILFSNDRGWYLKDKDGKINFLHRNCEFPPAYQSAVLVKYIVIKHLDRYNFIYAEPIIKTRGLDEILNRYPINVQNISGYWELFKQDVYFLTLGARKDVLWFYLKDKPEPIQINGCPLECGVKLQGTLNAYKTIDAMRKAKEMSVATAIEFSIPLLMQGFKSVRLINDHIILIINEFDESYLYVNVEGKPIPISEYKTMLTSVLDITDEIRTFIIDHHLIVGHIGSKMNAKQVMKSPHTNVKELQLNGY